MSKNYNGDVAYFYITLPDEAQANVFAYQIEGYNKIYIVEDEINIYQYRKLLIK